MDQHDIDFSTVPRNAPRCLECGRRTILADSSLAYPDEPHLHGQAIWRCECGAFGRCKPGTITPSSRPAGDVVRAARAAAYAAYKARVNTLSGSGSQRKRAKMSLRRAAAVASAPHDIRFEFGWLNADQAARVVDAMAE